VAPERHGQASGAAITTREVGGVLGVAIIAGVFASHGATTSPAAFLAGARPGLLVAALTVAAAALGALALPRRRPATRTGGRPAATPAPEPATS
jgi:hypothetical protein